MVGGSRDEWARRLHDLVATWGGREESSVVGYGTRVPAPNAALVNSTMAFALEYDDVHEKGRLHPGVVVVPTAFAVCELQQGVNGRDIITSLCAAIEFGCRLGIASRRAKPGFVMGGWDYASLHGYFTAAAVAAKLLCLDEQQVHHSLGIAYHQAAGNGQSALDAADTKKMGAGFASRGGITSVLLAARGMTGARAIFDESEAGLCNLYHAGCRRDLLTGGLGRKWEMVDLGFKAYPCCRLGHAYIDATLKLAEEHSIHAEEVEEVIPTVCNSVHVQLCAPLQDKTKPADVTAAQYSLPWMIACALVKKRVTLREFTEDALRDSLVLDLAARVRPVLDPALPDHLAFTTVKIRTRKGTFRARTKHVYGTPQNPLTFDAIEEKFAECSSLSIRPISKADQREIVRMAMDLEEVKDVSTIMRFLC
jgi:2-methylcitrate dehydratase PrpD